METENTKGSSTLDACAERLSQVSAALEAVLGKVEAQYESLNRKIDGIIAAFAEQKSATATEVEAQAAKHATGRKTLSPLTTALLAKGGVADSHIDSGALDKALGALAVEQRIAVKAEMARAGLLA